MFRVLRVLGVSLLTLAVLALMTSYESAPFGIQSVSRVFGLPVFAFGSGARGIIAAGQGDVGGVVVLAQAGYGLICVAQGGVGLVFGIGQGMVGLCAMAQFGVGISFFMGQVGGAMQAAGQGVFGRRSWDHMKALHAEITDFLRLRP